jgi:hypothetical protein
VLTADIVDNETTIPLEDTSQFPDSGRVRIEDEWIVYTAKTDTALTGLVRGANTTSATLHALGSLVISNNTEELPNRVYIEVASGTFSTNVTDTISVGNGSVSVNDARIVDTITDVSKNIWETGDYMYVDDNDTSDLNRYRTYRILDIVNISGETILEVDQEFSAPVAALGTVNRLNFEK